MQNGNITLVRGDDAVIGVNVYTSSGTAFNLSGYALVMTARQTQLYSSSPLLIVTTTGHLNAASGISQLTFSGAATAGIDDLQHFFDIKLYSSGFGTTGTPYTTTTLMYGNFQMFPL